MLPIFDWAVFFIPQKFPEKQPLGRRSAGWPWDFWTINKPPSFTHSSCAKLRQVCLPELQQWNLRNTPRSSSRSPFRWDGMMGWLAIFFGNQPISTNSKKCLLKIFATPCSIKIHQGLSFSWMFLVKTMTKNKSNMNAHPVVDARNHQIYDIPRTKKQENIHVNTCQLLGPISSNNEI